MVAINRFTDDTDAEIELVRKIALDASAEDAVPGEHWVKGGAGARALANAAVPDCELPSEPRFLYPLDVPIKGKIDTIATQMHGADGLDYTPLAENQIKQYTDFGYDGLPICMTKTQLSLSHDLGLMGAPKGWRPPIREIRASVGRASFLPSLWRHAHHAGPAKTARLCDCGHL